MANLQQQGVPWGSRLSGPRANYFRRQPKPAVRNQYVRTRTKTPTGSETVTTHYSAPNRSPRNAGLSDYNPAAIGSKSADSVGMLEGEFVICLGLLVLLMFANSTSSYAEKVMSIMKRGTLVCLLFFLLAIISGIGPNASRIAKAFGALAIVTILLTSPLNTAIGDVDSLIKNDWLGSDETGGNTAASADAGTSATANNQAEQAAISAAENAGLPGQLAALLPQNILSGIGSAAEKGGDAVKNFLRGFGI